jgi:hypothetical protein
MNIVVMKKNDTSIELLVCEDFDLSLLTAHSTQLFDFKVVLEKALNDFLNDYSEEMNNHKSMIEKLKSAGIIGYPVTPGKDARLYAADKKIKIDAELELHCE